jgi:hypothetical protein
MLKKTYAYRKDEVTKNRNCTMSSFMICAPRQILSGRLNQEERDGRDMWQARCKEKVYIGLWWENVRARELLEGLEVGGSILLEYIFKKQPGCSGLNRFD